MRSLFHGSNIRPSAPRNTPGYHRLGWCMALLVCAAWANPLAMAQPAASVVAWPRARATPQLALQDTAGRSWQLADQRGKLLVLNFWATWCEPCQAEMPALQQLPERYGAERLQVWAINYKEPPGKVAHFQQKWQLNMPVLLDTDGQAAGQWTRRIFPTTVLVDTQGRARWQVTGEFDWSSRQAHELLAPLLAPAPAHSGKRP